MNHALAHRDPSFKVPNRLILDASLSHIARRMGPVLYSRRNHLGACTRVRSSSVPLNRVVSTSSKSRILSRIKADMGKLEAIG